MRYTTDKKEKERIKSYLDTIEFRDQRIFSQFKDKYQKPQENVFASKLLKGLLNKGGTGGGDAKNNKLLMSTPDDQKVVNWEEFFIENTVTKHQAQGMTQVKQYSELSGKNE